MDNLEATLITGRTIKQGIALVNGKTTEMYYKNVAYVELSSESMEEIGVSAGEDVILESKWGKVQLPCKKAKLKNSIVFMPYGPWANKLIGNNTGGTGMPNSKGITVEIRKGETDDKTD